MDNFKIKHSSCSSQYHLSRVQAVQVRPILLRLQEYLLGKEVCSYAQTEHQTIYDLLKVNGKRTFYARYIYIYIPIVLSNVANSSEVFSNVTHQNYAPH
jgi:hypothetical protein